MEDNIRVSEQLLDGRNAYVVVAGSNCGGDVAVGLQEQGARVALLVERHDSAIDISLITSFASRAELSRAFAQAADHVGPPDLIVICVSPTLARSPCSLDQYTDESWHAYCQEPLKNTLYCVQEATAAMADKGGAVVLLGPTIGYTGASGLVALSTLAEGQRGLVKCAARQLGARGITVNWLALGSSQLYPDMSEVELPHVPEMGPPPLPLGNAPTLRQAVSVLAFLGSAGGRVMTGASLTVDGGEWMLP